MQLANQEAQRFNHEYIGAEHILMGLVKEGNGVAANVLHNLDIDMRRLRTDIEKQIVSGPDIITMGKLPHSPRAKRVMEAAKKEQQELNHNFLGTEHLILGLLSSKEGIAKTALDRQSIEINAVRREILSILGNGLENLASNEEPNDGLQRKKSSGKELSRREKVALNKARKERLKSLKRKKKLRGSKNPDKPYGDFSDRALKALKLANQEAQRFNHEYIGTEHLLLGLLKEGTGASTALRSLKVDLRSVRLEIEKLVQSGPEMITMGKLPKTPHAKQALEISSLISNEFDDEFVATEHILLALLTIEESVAAQVLQNLGLTLVEVHNRTMTLVDSRSEEPETHQSFHFEKMKSFASNSSTADSTALSNQRNVSNQNNSSDLPPELLDLTEPIDFSPTEAQNFEPCEETLKTILITLSQRDQNNIFLVGDQRHFDFYIGKVRESGLPWFFRKFAWDSSSQMVKDNGKLAISHPAFCSTASLILIERFGQLLEFSKQLTEPSNLSFEAQIEKWLRFPTFRFATFGEKSILANYPKISQHFTFIELPKLTRGQAKNLIVGEAKKLECYHLCSFSEEAINVAFETHFGNDQDLERDFANRQRNVISLLDRAAAKQCFENPVTDEKLIAIDQKIHLAVERYLASQATDNLRRAELHLGNIEKMLKARSEENPLTAITADHVKEVMLE